MRDLPEGTFLIVNVPVTASRGETVETLDGALRLVDEAQALADARRSASEPTEQYIRDWRESRQQSSQPDAAAD